MLRISRSEDDPHRLTIRLEGQLIGPWVDELRDIAGHVSNRECQLSLDVSEVTFADQAGVELLVSLRSRNFALTGCSPFLQERMKRKH